MVGTAGCSDVGEGDDNERREYHTIEIMQCDGERYSMLHPDGIVEVPRDILT